MSRTSPPPGLGIAFVLWSGGLGGAETYVVALAEVLRASGVDARVVILGEIEPLAQRLRQADIPFSALRFQRGRTALRHPRRFTEATSRAGPDGVVLPANGFLAPVLRLCGYRRRIVAVEHGSVLHRHRAHRRPLIVDAIDHLLGAAFVDVHVAVSGFVREHVRSRSAVTIPNGVDLDLYRPASAPAAPDEFVIGCVSRLVAGKGVEDVLVASESALSRGARLRIAGDGPQRPKLEGLAGALGIATRVTFEGWLPRASDVAAFWQGCDVAITAPNDLVESFGLGVVEAMACGRPAVATRVGGLEGTVVDGRTGILAKPRDTNALGAALLAYMDDPALVSEHGAAARARCEEHFDIRRCAERYADLFRPGNALR